MIKSVSIVAQLNRMLILFDRIKVHDQYRGKSSIERKTLKIKAKRTKKLKRDAKLKQLFSGHGIVFFVQLNDVALPLEREIQIGQEQIQKKEFKERGK
jgi:hypothetical protein